MFLHKTILTISNVGVGKPATRGAISWSMVLGRWTICGEIAAFTKRNPWQRRHVNMPVLMSSCIILHGDLLKPWSYYLVEEQWTFSTVFDKIMRGELSSSESEAYAVDIDQTEHRLVNLSDCWKCWLRLAALYAQKFSLNFQFEMIVFKKWTDHVTHLFLDDQGRSKRGGRDGSDRPNILLKKRRKKEEKRKEGEKEKQKQKGKNFESRPRNQFVISCLIFQYEGPPKVFVSFCLFVSLSRCCFCFNTYICRLYQSIEI